jgi:hypothetical protein
LRSSSTFDSLLDLPHQLAPIFFTQGRDDGPFAVAGTNGESQKESKPEG